jgi:hypothetical protein
MFVSQQMCWLLSSLWYLTPLVRYLPNSIMSSNFISLNLVNMNVRGSSDPKKCDIVKEMLLNHPSDLVLLQETKLSPINHFKVISFLTSTLQNFTSVDAFNASRGILTAWNSSNLKLLSTLSKTYSISSKF